MRLLSLPLPTVLSGLVAVLVGYASSAAIIWQAARRWRNTHRDRRLDDRPRYSHGHKHTNVNLVVSCAGFNRRSTLAPPCW